VADLHQSRNNEVMKENTKQSVLLFIETAALSIFNTQQSIWLPNT